MSRHGYLHSVMICYHSAKGASNILTRLKSRSLTGHSLPFDVYKHFGFEFHIVLQDNSCIFRCCHAASTAHRLYTQLKRGLGVVCSCVFDDRPELPLPSYVEPCCRTDPLGDCAMYRWADSARIRIRRKETQWLLLRQRSLCVCRSTHIEIMD
jgi:hypothetical protein